MEKTTFHIPAIYADHHVLRVRDLLGALPGIGDVHASSAFRRITVTYNPDVVQPQDIERALTEAGYAPGKEPELPTPPHNKEDGSAWFEVVNRVTETISVDREMSGDFRKY
ncbi:MAG: heavy-metal-associated domain-containing protein [Chloroflexi bacterium]|nr:heavy-metal-associated domain-containing protein [Chloroflexota bacterium]